MSENKKNLGKPDKILKIVEEILDFNKRIRNQPGEGLKSFKMDFQKDQEIPNQMPSRLPIFLA